MAYAKPISGRFQKNCPLGVNRIRLGKMPISIRMCVDCVLDLIGCGISDNLIRPETVDAMQHNINK